MLQHEMLAHYQLNLAQRCKWRRRPMLHPQLCAGRGQYNTLTEELRIHDRARFKNYTRLSPEMFDEVLERLIPRLQRQDTKFRKAILTYEIHISAFFRFGITLSVIGYPTLLRHTLFNQCMRYYFNIFLNYVYTIVSVEQTNIYNENAT